MNLVIGNTSQLSYYFPEEYVKISSRNIDFDYLKNNKWDSVYLTFAEQRVHTNESDIDYLGINFKYTFKIINSLIHNSNKIVCYSSCELFNELNGIVSITTSPCYKSSNDYIKSKLLLIDKIKELREIDSKYSKVIFVYPFYFNSVYRNKYFLFGKIFDSILNKKQIQVGNLDFQRDMVHASFVVEKSIEATQDIMVGAGNLVNVRNFIIDLYSVNNMDFNTYVIESKSMPQLGQSKLIMADVSWKYTYQNLLEDTQKDILDYKKINRQIWI